MSELPGNSILPNIRCAQHRILAGSILASVLLAACGLAYERGSDGIGDPYYPMLGNGGYDVSHYSIEVDVDLEARTIDAMVIIEATATQNLSTFNLDFGEYEVKEVRVNGEVADYEQMEREFTVIPSGPLRAGKEFVTSVSYHGNPQENVRRNQISSINIHEGWIFFADGVYVVGKPVVASIWFPVNEHPADKATYTFKITVPKPYEVAANGLLLSRIDNGDTWTYLWSARDPMASYLATVAIGEFDVEVERGPGGLIIRNYYQQDIYKRFRRWFKDQAEMIAYFESAFGPYPFEAYGVVLQDIFPPYIPLAMETQTMSLFTPEYAEELIVAHELAHQWFGDSISLNTWKDIWLNEGFASYAEILWLEHS